MKLQVNYWKVSSSLSFKSLEYDLLYAAKDVTAENRKLINWVSLGVCFKKFMFCLYYCHFVFKGLIWCSLFSVLKDYLCKNIN